MAADDEGAVMTAATRTPPALDPGEAAAFTEQARWLIGVFGAASDGLGTRAGVLLGFIPVAFTLLIANLSAIGHHDRLAKVALIACLSLLAASGICCLGAVFVREVSVPHRGQLLDQWDRYAHGGMRGLAHAQIGHSFLAGDEKYDPLAHAADEARSRARWFKAAVWCLVLAIVALAALGIDLVIKA
jgi:hypothetical protein